jgi:hypothetical protein
MAKRLKGVPNLPFAPIVAALFGLVSAILVFATPAWLLERVVASLGISSVLSAAQPPLGDTARLLFALVTGLITGLVLWAVMRPVEKKIHAGRVGKRASKATAPLDAAVDAPEGRSVADRLGRSGRAPIFADYDLGAPLMSDEALASGGELLLDQPFANELKIDELPSAWDNVDADWTDTVPETELETGPEGPAKPASLPEAPLVLEPPMGWDAAEPVHDDVPVAWDAVDPSPASKPLAWDAVQAPAEPEPTVWHVPAPVDTPEEPVVELNWGSMSVPPAEPERDDLEAVEFILEPAMIDEPVSFEVAQPASDAEPADTAPTIVHDIVSQQLDALAQANSEPVADIGLNAYAFEEAKPYEPVTFETHPAPEAEAQESTFDLHEEAIVVPHLAADLAEEGSQEEETSLTDLLARLEVALDRRAQLAQDGQQVSSPPSSGTVSSLRDLIAGNRKSVA